MTLSVGLTTMRAVFSAHCTATAFGASSPSVMWSAATKANAIATATLWPRRPFRSQLIDVGLADRDDGELGGDEEATGKHERQDAARRLVIPPREYSTAVIYALRLVKKCAFTKLSITD